MGNHKNGCPWKIHQCEGTILLLSCPQLTALICTADSIYRIPLHSPATMVRDLKTNAILMDPVIKNIDIKHPLVRVAFPAIMACLLRTILDDISTCRSSFYRYFLQRTGLRTFNKRRRRPIVHTVLIARVRAFRNCHPRVIVWVDTSASCSARASTTRFDPCQFSSIFSPSESSFISCFLSLPFSNNSKARAIISHTLQCPQIREHPPPMSILSKTNWPLDIFVKDIRRRFR